MRTAIAYLTSLLCHGAVLIPLAHISAWSDTPPRYSMQRGSAAAVSLRASLAASEEVARLDETQVVVAVMPPDRQPEPQAPPQPEADLTVLPEAKVPARAEPKAAVLAPEPPPTLPSPAVVPHPAKPRGIQPTAARSNETPTRQVASRRPGSTGADAVAGSSGAAGGGQVDRAASLVASNPVPPYPADALARGVGGLVLLRVRIAADGSVEEAAVEQSSGTPSLDESALSTVRRQWRFEPATRGGVAVSDEATVPIRFTIRAG